MLKINLSGEKPEKKQAEPEKDATVLAAKKPVAADIREKPEKSEKAVSGAGRTRTLLLLALLAVCILAYTKKDIILGLFGGGETVQDVAPPVPAPAPKPEPQLVQKEPDPVFVALNTISGTVPPRIWLTSIIVSYDGKYEIKGMAFSHESIATMIVSLGSVGSVASSNVPAKGKSVDAIYSFDVVGTLTGAKAPDILDAVPADKLVQMAAMEKDKSKEYGIEFRELPKEGAAYTDQDLPFSLQGSYDSLKKVVADLCPEGGDIRVFRIVVTPAAPGRTFDKVRASFSLRTVSAI